MKSNALPASAADYFDVPVCTEEGADLAYQAYLSQRAEVGHDFSHLLEERAWLQAAGPVAADPLS